MEYRLSSHSIYLTQYHLVFATKYRRKTLSPGFASYTKKVIETIADHIEAIEIQEINVQVDHVHLIIIIPPRYAVAKIVEILKSRSAKIIRKKFTWLNNVYYGTNSLWSKGYFVSTVGINETVIRRYVQYQRRQDSGQAKLEF